MTLFHRNSGVSVHGHHRHRQDGGGGATAERVYRRAHGRYNATLQAGFHLLMPFVGYDNSYPALAEKEVAIDIPAQVCTARRLGGIDEHCSMKVLDPERAWYRHLELQLCDHAAGADEPARRMASTLDKTFEERTNINSAVVTELDKASESWGVKVLRYEIEHHAARRAGRDGKADARRARSAR